MSSKQIKNKPTSEKDIGCVTRLQGHKNSHLLPLTNNKVTVCPNSHSAQNQANNFIRS